MGKSIKINKKHRYSSLLIIECDSNKLQTQNINIASEINDLFHVLPSCKRKFIRVYAKSDLCSSLSEISNEQYDVVVLTGHTFSDGKGIPVRFNLASDYKPGLSALPSFLNNFKPRCLIIASCWGGHFIPTGAMFKGIPTLEEIYGSPVLTNTNQLKILLFLIPYIISTDKFDSELLLIGNLINYLRSGGYIVRHTRKEFKMNMPMKALHQGGYDMLHKILTTNKR